MAIGIIVGIVIVLVAIGLFIWSGFEFNQGSDARGVIAIILAIAVGISFIIVPFSFHTVDTGTIAVVKHLGKAKDIKYDGTHYDFWMTNKYVKYDTKVKEIAIETMAYSSDAQQMTLQAKFQYQIIPDKVMEITKKYGDLKALNTRVQSIVTEKTKAVLSSYAAMDIISNRSNLSPVINESIEAALGKDYYVNVVNLAITNIDFSDAFENAVEEKMIAEQKQLKAKYEAEAKIVAAEAEAKANELLERSLTDKILQEMYISKWDGKLPQVVSDGSTMFQIPAA